MSNNRGQCGHILHNGDLHQLCYKCRTEPRKQFPVFHQCQKIGEKKGNMRLCSVCMAVTPAVRDQWAICRSRTHQGIESWKLELALFYIFRRRVLPVYAAI